MLPASIQKNDRRARLLIFGSSIIVFLAIAALGRTKLDVELGFDVHVFAMINAFINSTVSVLLVAALIAVLRKRYILHKRLMLTALIFSCVFLVSYICHHLFAGETTFGGEGTIKYIYYFILVTHIILAALILPFILYTTYHGLTAEFRKHKRLGWITWPIWFYVAVTGVVVYLMISPYYQ